MVCINNKPNGKNINFNCGAVNINELSKKVVKQKADIGFAFDGDGDRLIAVDEKGNEIDGDKIIALFAEHFVKPIKKKNKYPIVTTVMSNIGLENFILSNFKINLKRSSVGDINVIKEMQKHDSILGGEQSGHIILSQYSKTGDGILAALKVTEIMSKVKKSASSLFNLYENFPQIKINIPYKKISKNSLKYIKNLNKKKLKDKNMRLLLRLSGTEPLIRILVEGKNQKSVEEQAKIIEINIRSKIEK